MSNVITLPKAPIYQPDNITLPHSHEDYRSYLLGWGVLDRGFAFGELVKPRHRDWRGKFKQPEPMFCANRGQGGGWHRMVPTLYLANELRRRMVEGYGARGLRVAAAYRPTGGSRRSQHKVNAALDLDLLKGDYHLTTAYYKAAIRLWSEYGADFQMGLGLYCRRGALGGIRVHIDTGMACRTWQYSRGRSIRPTLAERVCEEHGLQDPRSA